MFLLLCPHVHVGGDLIILPHLLRISHTIMMGRGMALTLEVAVYTNTSMYGAKADSTIGAEKTTLTSIDFEEAVESTYMYIFSATFSSTLEPLYRVITPPTSLGIYS